MSYRLFISHSTPKSERARLLETVDYIRNAGSDIKVLYDQEQIQSGDEWRRRICYLLHACDGAVILLDDNALSSDWVFAEATFLSVRATYDQGFQFLPVALLPEANLRKRLSEDRWHPIAMSDWQIATGANPHDVAATVIAALSRVGSLTAGWTLVERLADQIAEPLRHAPKRLLHELASELGDEIPYDAQEDAYRSALVLARHMIREGSLLGALERMRPLGPSFVAGFGLEVLEQLKPLPIDAEAAAMLRYNRVGGGLAHTWLQTMNPGQTAALYIARAYLTYYPVRHVVLIGRHQTAESVRAELLDECRRTLYRRNANSMSDGDIRDALREQELYVCMPPVDSEVFNELATDFPRIGFILHHQADSNLEPPGGLQVVAPPLQPDREARILRELRQAMAGL